MKLRTIILVMLCAVLSITINVAGINLKLSATAEANKLACNKAVLVCWYYDICHDDPDNPKHEVWTDKGRAKLHEWAMTAAKGIPADMLPEEVREWAVK